MSSTSAVSQTQERARGGLCGGGDVVLNRKEIGREGRDLDSTEDLGDGDSSEKHSKVPFQWSLVVRHPVSGKNNFLRSLGFPVDSPRPVASTDLFSPRLTSHHFFFTNRIGFYSAGYTCISYIFSRVCILRDQSAQSRIA